MRQKRVVRYFRPGDLTGLERALDAASRVGWQALRPGRLVQRYAAGEGTYVHRLDYCPHRPGSGDEITFLAARERAGWTLAARRKGWLLYRKPAAEAAASEALPEGREPIRALFAQRVRRLESFRRGMLLLAAPMMIGGYVSDLLPLLYASALPLLGALYGTLRIKWMEEGLAK